MILKPTKFRLPIKGHWGTKGLVACFLFNDSPPLLGKTLDVSGNRNNGTLFGDTHVVAGKFGPALSFDGNDDYTRAILNGTALTKFTIEFWVYPMGAETSKGIFQWANALTSTEPWLLLQRNAPTTVRWYLNGNYQISNIPVSDNKWYHFVLTYNGTTATAYTNGISSGTYAGGITTQQASALYVYFGNGYNGYFNGLFDKASIYNRGVTAAEVAELYAESFCMFDRERIELWSQGAPPSGLSIPVAMRYYRNRRVA